MTFRKLTSVALALVMALSLSVPVFAAEPDASDSMVIGESGGYGYVPVILTTEGGAVVPGGDDDDNPGGGTLTFRVTVPTTLPAVVTADNEVITATNARIVNLSAGPVEVTSMTYISLGGWDIVDYGTDLADEAVGTKVLALEVNGCPSTSDPRENNTAFDQHTFMSDFRASGAGTDYLWSNHSAHNAMGVDYNIEIAPQGRAMHEEKVAAVVFTVAFYDA